MPSEKRPTRKIRMDAVIVLRLPSSYKREQCPLRRASTLGISGNSSINLCLRLSSSLLSASTPTIGLSSFRSSFSRIYKRILRHCFSCIHPQPGKASSTNSRVDMVYDSVGRVASSSNLIWSSLRLWISWIVLVRSFLVRTRRWSSFVCIFRKSYVCCCKRTICLSFSITLGRRWFASVFRESSVVISTVPVAWA